MDAPASNALVVLTQNAWGGAPLWTRRAERLAAAITELDPDVVGLQEIHADDPLAAESQAHELASALDRYEVIFAPARVTAKGHCEGVALLVRRGIPIEDRAVLRLSVDPDDALDAPHQRVVLRVAIRRGALVDVMVTHLSLSKRARERTLRELVKFAADTRRASGSAAAVLMGDFNAVPREPSLAQLDGGGWIDVWERTNPEERGATWPSAAPFRRLDYIWAQLGQGWGIAECQRMPIAGSDHVGLFARLTFP